MSRKGNENNRKIKVGCISMHPAPYRDPVFTVMSKSEKITFKVISLFRIPKTHSEWMEQEVGYDNHYLDQSISVPVMSEYHKGLLKILWKEKYDVLIIPGYYPLTCLAALIYAWVTKTPYIFAADSVSLPLGKKVQIGRLKQFFIRKASSVWITGKASRYYMTSFAGVDGHKILEGYYMMDGEKLSLEYKKERSGMLKREQLGVGRNVLLFLFIGKLIPSRNVEDLLQVFLELEKERQDLKLLIIGNGEQNDIVKQYIEKSKHNTFSHIEQIPYDELKSYYSGSDFYIHPGAEPYSLALVEAVIAGKAVISTDEVGAAYDFIENGINGYIVKKHDRKALKESIKNLAGGEIKQEDVSKMKEKAIEKYNIERMAKEVIEKVQA